MKKRLFNLVLIIISAVIFLLITIYLLELINFTCIYRKLFNIYCPGCGLTRMIKSLFEFKIYQAFRYNPLFFVLLILIIPYLINYLILYIRKGIVKNINFKLIIFIVILLFIYMLLRNLPGFEFLLPTKVL